MLLPLHLHCVNEFGIKWTKKKQGLRDWRVKWIESARERNGSQLTPDPWDETIDCREVITSTFYVCSQTTNEASEDQCSLVLNRALAWLSRSRHGATSSPQTYWSLNSIQKHESTFSASSHARKRSLLCVLPSPRCGISGIEVRLCASTAAAGEELADRES